MPLETLAGGGGRSLTTKGLGSGLSLGKSAIMHAALFADVGYDTNVYYSGTPTSAAVLHLIPRLEITNASRDGHIPSGVYYDLFAALDWRKYLSDEKAITDQDAINPTVGGTAEFSSGQVVSLTIAETFARFQQAPFAEGDPITRNNNLASAGLKYAPDGGRLRFNLRYTNLIDAYEAGYSESSNMTNELMLDIGWRWLPKTTLFVRASQGVTNYFDGNRPTSYPLRTLAGLRGLLTEKLSVNLAAGYGNAFYSSGENPSGFGNVGIVAELNYSIDLLSRAGFGYHHDFVNSPFVGQFYNMDAVYAAYQQLVAARVLIYLFGRYENRRFYGGPERTDNYVMGGVSVDYMLGRHFLLGASYYVNLNRSSPEGGASGGLDYTKQVLLFRLGAVY